MKSEWEIEQRKLPCGKVGLVVVYHDEELLRKVYDTWNGASIARSYYSRKMSNRLWMEKYGITRWKFEGEKS